MAFQSIEIGTAANDGTGDTLRAGGDKTNDNFLEIYTLLGTGTALTSGISATSSVVSLASPTITGVTSFADGSAGAPSITNSGDTNTGIFFSAADQVAITTGGTARLTVSSTVATFAGNIIVPDDGDVGSASATDAIQISSAGIVTFKDDILIKDGGTIGVASATTAMTISSAGIVTFVDDILIKDAGTIGNATTAAAITIEADGDIVLSDDLYISGGLIDLKNEGSVSQLKFYCESSNAHAQTLQSAPHALASSAVCVLPTLSGTLVGSGDSGTVTGTMLAAITAVNKIGLAAIDIDGGTDVGADLTAADLIIVDDGAGGTNRKAALSRVVTLTSGEATALAIALG